MKRIYLLSVVVCGTWLVGCQESADITLPEVNQANCTPEHIRSLQLPELEKRQFATACATSGGYASGPKKTY